MLTFKFFVVISIIGNFINSLKCLKRDKSPKTKAYMIVSTLLLCFSIFIIVDAFL